MMDNRKWYERMISPSRVDEYLQFMSGVKYNFGDMPPYELSEFIDKLLKIECPLSKRKADAGTACHSMLEKSQYEAIISGAYYKGEISKWGIVIDIDKQLYLPYIRESWVRGNFANCEIIGKVDAIDGYSVYDHKFTSQIDIEKYINSVQWKMYLIMTGRDRFVYNLFQVKVEDNEDVVIIKDFQELILYSYPGMLEEIEQIIADYRDLLLSIEPLIKNRVIEFNNLINDEIARINDSPIITARNQIIEILKTKFISVKGLTI